LGDRETTALTRMLGESAIGAVGAVVGFLVSYAILGVLTRYLSLEDFGVYAMLVSLLDLAIVFALCGLPQAIDRFTAMYNAREESGKSRSLAVRGVVFAVAVGGIGFAGLALASRPIAGLLLGSSDRATALILFSASFPIALLLRTLLAVSIGHKQLRHFVLVDRLLIPGLKLILGLGVLALGYGLLGWLGAYCAAMVAGLACAWRLVRLRIWPDLADHAPERISFRRILGFAWPLVFVDVTIHIARDVPVLLLGRAGTIESAGILRIYLLIAGFLVLVLSAVSRIHKPVITDLITRGHLEEARSTHQRVSKWAFVVGVYSAGILFVLGREFVAILFTPAYAQEFSALLILSAGALARLASGPGGAALQAMGATRRNLLSAVLGLFAMVVSGAFLIPRLGILGAALAISLFWAIRDGTAAWQARRLGGFISFGSAHLKCALVAALTIGGFLLLRHITSLAGPAWNATFGIAFTGVYWAGLLLWNVVDSVDRELLSGVLKRGTPAG